MPVLEMWADLHCPYAYLAAFRLRRALGEPGAPEVEVRHRALAIEYVDSKVTPKPVLDAESPLILLQEPDLPWRPWAGLDSAWPVTMWPAFEAVECARLQGWRAAHDMDWALREAFFAESRCISMRHVILDVARGVSGLDAARLERDWDAGVGKGAVVVDAREGWDRLGLEVSPTFLLPDGTRRANPAGPLVELDAEQGHKLVGFVPPREEPRDAYRRLLRACAGSA